MTKDQRDIICKSCQHYTVDDRYGIICGLTNNIANFQDTCRTYKKRASALVLPKSPKPVVAKKKKKSTASWILNAVWIWFLFKAIMFILKALND